MVSDGELRCGTPFRSTSRRSRNIWERFDTVLTAMRQRVPGVSDVEARPTEDGRLVLRFQDGSFKDPFIARFDGTIKMFAYLVLLYEWSEVLISIWSSKREQMDAD